MTTENPLPRYFKLLEEAHAAQRAEDDFDVHSENPTSAAAWKRLCDASDARQVELITYVREHGDAITAALERAPTFEGWFDALEGFGLRCESANEEIRPGDGRALERWLRAAWLMGAAAAKLEEPQR
jgi:hypothetical protein